MMKYALILLYTYCCAMLCGQELQQRLVLFGDAGEINAGQEGLLAKASEFVVPGKTTVFFLGDNIYPLGMGLVPEEAATTATILRSQYTSFIEKGVPVTFIAGNHDWDKSGRQGLEKIKAQADYIHAQQSALLHFVPQAGTGGIARQALSDHVTALLYDSEYWLFPWHSNPDSAVDGRVRAEFVNALAHHVQNEKDKMLLLVSHHPMQSFGEHGIRFTWKDHLFPLTRKWKCAYLPFPLLGSVYPVLRSTVLKTAEDLKHPTYKRLIGDTKTAVKDHKNVIFVSGHDHGLQFIVEGNYRQIVSGSGSKTSHISPDKTLKYKYNKQGFCVLDCLSDGSLDLSFYIYGDEKITKSFQDHIYPN